MSLATTRAMVGAEILKLRRNRPLIGFALLLSIGVIVVLFGYDALQHASNPSRHGPAGGTVNFRHAVRALGLFFGGLVAILVGAEAGTADQTNGVFRDLVATGRSRPTLFAVRAPAAIAITWLITGAAFALAAVATYAFAGDLPTPNATTVFEAAAWVAFATAVQAALAVSVGTFTGSRALTLTALIGWQTIVTELLVDTSSLGSARDGLLSVALGDFIPVGPGLGVGISDGLAVGVVAVWMLIPALIAAWRIRAMDP
jgi:hypothetical protein